MTEAERKLLLFVVDMKLNELVLWLGEDQPRDLNEENRVIADWTDLLNLRNAVLNETR